MGETEHIQNYQVKVDNWPLFFLQRLHHFYRKKTHCDLTLLFSSLDTVKSIKVHKLVLHACTDYFESLDIMKDSEHGEFLQLSNEMHPDVVIPIISFMYTGKLEFPVTLQPKLYEAATKLRMTILTKLLDVQPGKNFEKSAEQPLSEVSIVQSNVTNLVESIQDGQDMSVISADVSSPNITSSTKTIENPIITFTPVPKPLPQQKKNLKLEVSYIQRSAEIVSEKVNSQKILKTTKKSVGLQLGALNSKPKIVDVNLPPTLPGRKLPVWKRKVPFTGSQSSENIQNVRSTLKASEMPKPTRFEWDEDLNDPTVLRPVEDASKILSHDGPIKIIHPIILDGEVSKHKDTSDESLRRSSDGSSSESPPYKKSKSDLQDMKEYGKQQQLRNEIICNEENLDDMMDTDDLYGTCDDEPDDLSSLNQPSLNCSTPKPILKTVPKPELPMSSKRVRFSLEGKENNQQENETGNDFTMNKPESTVAKQKIVLPVETNQVQSGKQHIKIVSEVLKKFPNLAKRENIKLRVVSKNPAAVPSTVQKAVEGDTGAGSKSSSSLVSYIFLTNKGSGELISLKNEKNDKDKEFDVENRTGPWICRVCDEENPIEFDSYYTYRKHLVEVHELKIDARICEYCGLKNSKRNHLLYHLYTKHGINPPAHFSFPKCPECDYIALSDALLFKHRATHDTKFMCYTCNVVFKTNWAMQLHLRSDWHRNKINEVSVILSDYPCPFCDARFESGNDLKNHMETCHHSQKVSTNEGQKQIYRCPYCESLYGNADFLGKHIVSVHWGKDGKNFKEDGINAELCQPQSGQQLQYSANAETSTTVATTENQPSSEMESLSNVASGISTSLNLVSNEQAVVYYEQKAQEQDIGREATVVAEECEEYMITDSTEDINSKQSHESSSVMEIIDVENEDSNSRMSNTEEVNPTSCSDHDYSEPQIDENFTQVVPVHSVANQIVEGSVIQQIVPDQGLVFADQGNVVFQSPCVNLPQRVLITSGEVVIPRESGEQNVILSQVIPQTQIILSGSILQRPSNIINERNGTIVFSNSETTQLDNIETVHYQIHTPENIESEVQAKQKSDSVQESQEVGDKVGEEKQMSVIENVLEVSKVENSGKEKESEESDSNLNTVPEDYKLPGRAEASKIVDDWDELNENSSNVESRSDRPSRPEFF